MSGSKTCAPTKVLVVANRTASTPALLEEVARRSNAQPTEFVVLVPDVRERNAADWTRETAVALLSRAARKPVGSVLGGPDLLEAVRHAIRAGDFDEIIVSTHTSKWRRHGLIHRIERLGYPVTAVNPTPTSIRDSSDGLGVTLAPSVCCSTRVSRRLAS